MTEATRKRHGHELSSADRRRLVEALGYDDFDVNEPIFDPTSITHRIHKEAALLLGGGRALMMQIAHPLVAEGVRNFSNFREDPLGRLWRTLELTLAVSFASATDAMRAVREIERAHAKVHGTLKEDVGPFAAGTRYRATDSELMFWVHATLVDSAILVYDRFVAPLSREDREEYYEGSKVTARVMGIEDEHVPSDYGDFELYLSDMLDSDVLTVGPSGREVADAVLYPKRPFGLSQIIAPARLLTFEILPETLKERFETPSVPLASFAFGTLAEVSRAVLPWIPAPLRAMPYARA